MELVEKIRQTIAGSSTLRRSEILASLSRVREGLELTHASLAASADRLNSLKTAAPVEHSAEADWIDISAAISSCIGLHRDIFASQGIELEFHDLAPSLESYVNESVLRDALGAILDNCRIHAFPQLANRRAHVVLRAASGFASIEIYDNGTGIPRDILERVGDPFFFTSKVGAGIGLGFFLAKTWIEDIAEAKLEIHSPLDEFFDSMPLDSAHLTAARTGTCVVVSQIKARQLSIPR